MCRSDVATNVWMRGRAARSIARQARSMSAEVVRARAATTGRRTSRATAWTARKSSSEAIGKPASITSTPRASIWRAIRTFSSRFMLAPGDCSPSRNVVSKMISRWGTEAPRIDGCGVLYRPAPMLSTGFPAADQSCCTMRNAIDTPCRCPLPDRATSYGMGFMSNLPTGRHFDAQLGTMASVNSRYGTPSPIRRGGGSRGLTASRARGSLRRIVIMWRPTEEISTY